MNPGAESYEARVALSPTTSDLGGGEYETPAGSSDVRQAWEKFLSSEVRRSPSSKEEGEEIYTRLSRPVEVPSTPVKVVSIIDTYACMGVV
ncbi:hypothetical protein KIPB_013757 [Kipferlia bialata]|uniref:Uncharacterized protein n=1 Tax=Kipferlia bialata TaxID=797122 RepID=A0A391P997_9EUKA|nr:hypothetical protein KIPB_013757 [Kipferlia bialata]|eukprot:g13757.t1